jgi:transcriptional regulator with XRE-family HTH domain
MRRRLDVEMRPFRRGAADKDATQGLLRAVRLALRIPMDEIAQTMGIRRTNVFYLEERERKGTIGMQALCRSAEAMGCVMVYGIVPRGGKTMEALYEERLWAAVLGVPELNRREREGVAAAGAAAGVRCQVSGIREQS